MKERRLALTVLVAMLVARGVITINSIARHVTRLCNEVKERREKGEANKKKSHEGEERRSEQQGDLAHGQNEREKRKTEVTNDNGIHTRSHFVCVHVSLICSHLQLLTDIVVLIYNKLFSACLLACFLARSLAFHFPLGVPCHRRSLPRHL